MNVTVNIKNTDSNMSKIHDGYYSVRHGDNPIIHNMGYYYAVQLAKIIAMDIHSNSPETVEVLLQRTNTDGTITYTLEHKFRVALIVEQIL